MKTEEKLEKIIEKLNKSWKKAKGKIWFKIFKKNLLKLKPDNRIELAKFSYQKDFQLATWIIGIGIVIFLSVNMSGIINLEEGFFYISGIVVYILTPILFLIGILLLIKGTKREKIKMAYLYQLKEKQDKK